MSKSIEDYLLTEVLKKIIITDGSLKYIIEEDLKKMDFSKEELDFVKKIMKKNNIIISKDNPRKEIKLKKEYNTLINNDNIEGIKIEKKYSKFQKQLENKIIPSNIILLKTANTEKENFFIKKSVIDNLKLEESEIKILKEYLKNNNIFILHDNKENQSLKDIEYYSSQNNSLVSCNLTKEKINDLVKKYKTTKDEIAKEHLIIGHLKLLKYTARKLSKEIPYDENELESIGYEGLFKSIEEYNSKENISVFIYKYLNNYIINNLYESLGIKDETWVPLYIKTKLIVEKENGVKLEENPDLIELVITEITKNRGLSEKAKNIIRNGLINNNALTDNIEDNNFDNIILDKIKEEELKEEINKFLKEFSEIEQEVLTYRYGLNGAKKKTLLEIAKMKNVTPERIRQITINAIKKLRHPSKTKILKEFYNDEDYGELQKPTSHKKRG